MSTAERRAPLRKNAPRKTDGLDILAVSTDRISTKGVGLLLVLSEHLGPSKSILFIKMKTTVMKVVTARRRTPAFTAGSVHGHA